MRRKQPAGDEAQPDEAFVAFFAAESDRLQRFATFLCGDPDVAADLAQEALARAYAAWPRLDGRDPAAYVRRILVNVLRDRKRRERVRRDRFKRSPVPVETVADSSGVERLALMEALSILSPTRRAVVILRFYEDMSEERIAEILERPAGTVRSDLHRALKALRPLLQTDDLVRGGSHGR